MTTNHDLAKQIEELVRNHIESTHHAVAAAVERAFSTTTTTNERPVVNAARRKPRAKGAPRRAVAEVLALAERFYAAVCRHPGETMATLAPQVGASARELHVAVKRLEHAGRVRRVGQRQFTRYFPPRSPRNARRSRGGEQRGCAGARGVGLAAAREEGQHILALLARGVDDRHQALGEEVATITLRAEAATAP